MSRGLKERFSRQHGSGSPGFEVQHNFPTPGRGVFCVSCVDSIGIRWISWLRVACSTPWLSFPTFPSECSRVRVRGVSLPIMQVKETPCPGHGMQLSCAAVSVDADLCVRDRSSFVHAKCLGIQMTKYPVYMVLSALLDSLS